MKMEYRGQKLLKKWLDGDIAYHEELELFAIAEQDVVIREALEGYIGQEHIEGPAVLTEVKVMLHPETKHKQVVNRRFTIAQIVAALLVLVTAGGIYMIRMEATGEAANSPQAVIEDIMSESPRIMATAEYTVIEQPEAAEISVPKENVASDIVEHNLVDVAQGELAEADRIEINPQPLAIIDEEQAVATLEESPEPVEVEAFSIVESALVAVENSEQDESEAPLALNIGLESFNDELDDAIRNNVKFKENAAGDEVITGYEIDVLPGQFGTAATAIETRSNNNVDVQGKVNMADAAGRSNSTVRTNKINNNVVVTEYVIQKRDLTHPPIQDFNSLVREKYKRRAKPVDGFYSYRRFLKDATQCLVANQSNVSHLEEGIIKFRVYSDGSIDFLDFFGTQSSDCVDAISASVVNGPKWEVKEFYESLDIEVPFKTLYPYLF